MIKNVEAFMLKDAVIEEGRLISVIEEHRKGGFVVYKTIVTS